MRLRLDGAPSGTARDGINPLREGITVRYPVRPALPIRRGVSRVLPLLSVMLAMLAMAASVAA